MSTTIAAPRDDRDWVAYRRIAAHSFGASAEHVTTFREHGMTRLVLAGGEVIAGATALLTHQYFGGRAVPAGAVSMVCVAPEHRGRGVAAALIDDLATMMRAHGCLVTSLWTPSTGVYRRHGWAVAGVGREWTVQARSLRAAKRTDHRVVPGAGPGVRDLHERVAARWNGPVRRPEWWWRWKYPSTEDVSAYHLADPAGRVCAFVAYRREPAAPWGHRVVVTDCWAADHDALTGVYDFLGGHATLADHVTFTRSTLPAMPSFLWRLDQHDATDQGRYPWMIRVLDVAAALRARGWPAGVRGDIGFLVGAAHRVTLHADGPGTTVTAGGDGRVRLSEGDFAAWYAGALDAGRLGELVTSAPEDIELMTALTSGRGPWLPDTF